MNPVPRGVRMNLWIANHVWLVIVTLVVAVMALCVGVAILAGRVGDLSTRVAGNAESIDQLRYRSCIEDAVVEFKIAEGRLLQSALTTGKASEESKTNYSTALDALAKAQDVCHVRFPESQD